MRNKAYYLVLLIGLLFGCNQKQDIKGASEFQKQLNAVFKDASRSPLKKKDLNAFSSLEFFKIDSNFVVTAQIEKAVKSDFKPIKTTTDTITLMRIYGKLRFVIAGQRLTLDVYQAKDAAQNKTDKLQLFLPFLDQTNGETTYSGGRYMDLIINKTDSVLTLNFNQAYNPYCAYNDQYSCPIVPRQNYLPIQIKAGVKAHSK